MAGMERRGAAGRVRAYQGRHGMEGRGRAGLGVVGRQGLHSNQRHLPRLLGAFILEARRYENVINRTETHQAADDHVGHQG